MKRFCGQPPLVRSTAHQLRNLRRENGSVLEYSSIHSSFLTLVDSVGWENRGLRGIFLYGLTDHIKIKTPPYPRRGNRCGYPTRVSVASVAVPAYINKPAIFSASLSLRMFLLSHYT